MYMGSSCLLMLYSRVSFCSREGRVCIIGVLHPGGVCILGVSIIGGLHPGVCIQGDLRPRGSASGGVLHPGRELGIPPRIRSTSGRYASYWPAFLF